MSHLKNVLTTAGAFMAWVIGSGFATGQETLRYFSSYADWSWGAFFVTTVGFLFFGQVLLLTGYNNRRDVVFPQFRYFCGDRLGTFYSRLIPFTLILLMSVLFSGAGATISEYYGLQPFIGSAVMAVLVLVSYLIGFKRLVQVVSFVGPLMIIFVLTICVLTTWRGFSSGLSPVVSTPVLANKQAAPTWFLSGLLYVSLIFFPGSTYFVNLGAVTANRRAIRQGTVLGSFMVLLTIAMLNMTLLLHAEEVAVMEVPMLSLATTLSSKFAVFFSIALVLGVFSSCSVMMWTVCSRFPYGGDRGNRLFAVAIALLTFVLSLIPFGDLLGVFYPFIGYLGLIFIAAVVREGIKQWRRRGYSDIFDVEEE